jgi:hypothetical protein
MTFEPLGLWATGSLQTQALALVDGSMATLPNARGLQSPVDPDLPTMKFDNEFVTT